MSSEMKYLNPNESERMQRHDHECWCGYNGLAIQPAAIKEESPPRKTFDGYKRCAYCANSSKFELCRHHHEEGAKSWSAENRIYCISIHNGKDLPWLQPEERDTDADEFRERYREDQTEGRRI